MAQVGERTAKEILTLKNEVDANRDFLNEKLEEFDTIREVISAREAEVLAIGEEHDRNVASLNSTISFLLGTNPTENAQVRESISDNGRVGIQTVTKKTINFKLLAFLGLVWFIMKKKK